jgi:hypothetical protein
MYSLIVTAKINGVDPQAWLSDVNAGIAAHPSHRLDELLSWKWTTASCPLELLDHARQQGPSPHHHHSLVGAGATRIRRRWS